MTWFMFKRLQLKFKVNLNKPNIKNPCQMMSTEVSGSKCHTHSKQAAEPRRSREDKRIANRNTERERGRERESVITTSVCAPS